MRLQYALSLGFFALAGCVLLIDVPDTLNSSCTFRGMTTSACGKCIAKACQRDVDRCCGTKACSILSDLDECAGSASTLACTSLQASLTTGAENDAVRSCVRSQCASVCQGGGTGPGPGTDASIPTPTGTTHCTKFSNDSCSCDMTGTPNATECSTRVVPNAVCCADLGWPAKNLDCRCETFSCRDTTDGCDCLSLGSWGPNPSCSGSTCCLSGSGCDCRSSRTSCFDAKDSVGSCSAQTAKCGSNQVKVTSCSR